MKIRKDRIYEIFVGETTPPSKIRTIPTDRSMNFSYDEQA